MKLLLEDRDRQPSVLLITLNRPERANALSKPLLLALEQTLHQASDDDQIRCIVITGAGSRAFSAGADISEQTGFSPEDAYDHMRWGQDLFSRLAQLHKPTIAAINGFALGGGLELALACDFRAASESARLGLPEVTLASLPGWGGTQRLPRLIGVSRAMLLAMTGEPVSARAGLDLGLVNSVHTPEALLDATLTLAATLASRSPASLRAIKQVMRDGLDGSLGAGMEAEARAVARLWGSAEQQHAQAAFFARRQTK